MEIEASNPARKRAQLTDRFRDGFKRFLHGGETEQKTESKRVSKRNDGFNNHGNIGSILIMRFLIRIYFFLLLSCYRIKEGELDTRAR